MSVEAGMSIIGAVVVAATVYLRLFVKNELLMVKGAIFTHVDDHFLSKAIADVMLRDMSRRIDEHLTRCECSVKAKE